MRLRGQEIAAGNGMYNLASCLPAADRPRLLRHLSTTRLRFLSCRLWQVGRSWHISRRVLSNDFLFLPLCGHLTLTTPFGTWPLDPGAIAVIPTGLPHAIAYRHECQSLQVIGIHVSYTTSSGDTLLASEGCPVLNLPEIDQWRENLLTAAALMDDDVQAGRVWGEAICRLLLTELVRLGLPCRDLEREIDPRLRLALDLARADPHAGRNLIHLAQVCGLKPSRFRSLFRQQLGVAPKIFFDRLRLARAEELLSSTSATIADIARASGFPCLRHFLARFKAEHGESPSAWRQRKTVEV